VLATIEVPVRIPFPERIPYFGAVAAATLLFGIQLLQGTDNFFAFLCFLYIMVTVAAFNAAGGMYRPAGAYIGFTALLTALIGFAAKAYFHEAADSNLREPLRTMEVYLAGSCAMWMAASVERAMRPARPLVGRWFPLVSLRSVYLGAAIIGTFSNLLWIVSPGLTGIFAFARKLDDLVPFAIILGVMHTVRSSKGKSSVTPFLLVLMAALTVEGVAAFSKQGLFSPIFCWALGAGIARYRLKLVNVLVLGVIGFFLLHYGVTIVQVGKNSGYGSDLRANFKTVENLYLHFDETRSQYTVGDAEQEAPVTYFNHPEGFLDRLNFLPTDDRLIQNTDQDGPFGYLPVVEGFDNLIPHFLWADKPVPYFGNVYAHTLGLLADDDTTTGVSFGVTADAYKEGEFTGVLVVMPLILAVVFCAISLVVGDIRDHPSAVLLVLIVAHVGPEGMIPGLILLILDLFIIVVFAVLSRFVFPLIAAAVLPPPGAQLGELSSSLGELSSAID
jgi:hypothetical protein